MEMVRGTWVSTQARTSVRSLATCSLASLRLLLGSLVTKAVSYSLSYLPEVGRVLDLEAWDVPPDRLGLLESDKESSRLLHIFYGQSLI